VTSQYQSLVGTVAEMLLHPTRARPILAGTDMLNPSLPYAPSSTKTAAISGYQASPLPAGDLVGPNGQLSAEPQRSNPPKLPPSPPPTNWGLS